MHILHFRCKIPITTINPKLMMINLKSRTLSSSSITQLAAPTHDNIIQLILDQKTPSQAFQTFNWASKLPNFTHNQSTYRVLIHKLCTLWRFSDARQVLDEMPHSIGSPPEEGVFITFIRGLGRGKRIKDVILVPDLMRKFGVVPSLKVYNAILDVLVKEDIDIAKGFYRRKMMEGGVNGDNYTFGILMKGLCLTNRVGDGFKLLQVMKGKGLTPNTVIYNTMLHNLCKNGNVVKAKRLMSLMEERSDVTYNLMISAYCKEGNAVQAQMLLEEGFASGCVPDAVATTKVIDLLCNAGRVNDAADLVERVEKRGAVIDVVAYNTLIKGFCSIEKAQHGLHFKKQMEKKGFLPNVETYNILIDGFCSMGMLDRAMDMFDEMKQSAINRNFITFNTLIKGFCSKGKVDDAFKILELMEETKRGNDGHICPYNSIIYGLYRENRMSEALEFLNKMSNKFPRAVRRTLAIIVLCKDGNIESAKEVYEKMLHEGGVPSVLVYDNLINCFSKHNRFDEGVKLMNEMVDRGYTPVASTYDTAISGFSDPAEIASALNRTEEMEKKGYSLDVGSYSPLILALCNAGDLEKAFKFLQQMVDKGIGPDYSTWISMVYCLNRKTKWCEPNNLSSLDNRIQLIVET